MISRVSYLAALAVAVAVVLAPSSGAAPRMMVGVYDEHQTLFADPGKSFRLMRSLRAQVVRTNLYWGGRLGARPPQLVVPRMDDPANYGKTKQPSVALFGLEGEFRAPAQPARYQYALLHSGSHGAIRSLKAANAKLRVLVYKNVAATFSTATHDGQDNEFIPSGVGFERTAAEHPEWFLTDKDGARVESCLSPGRWLMDVGNEEYQTAWIENVAAEAKEYGWDGVLLDDVSASPTRHLCGKTLDKYETDEAYAAAMDSFLSRAGPALQERGFLAIPNIRIAATAAGQSRWARWLSFASGGALEGWTKSGRTATGHVAGDEWRVQQELLRLTERADKIFLALTFGPADDIRSRRYARASFLLGWEAGQGALLYVPDPSAEPWSPETAVEPGLPLGPASQVGSVWKRDFAEGVVYVNPSASAATVELDNTYVSPSGQQLTRVTLEPATGIVLRFPNFVGGTDVVVARRRPRNPTDPADPAYNWALYDRTVHYAAQHRVQLVFSILGTPSWANGGKGVRFAPTNFNELRDFAYAAARRYSGTYRGPDGRFLPAVRMWLAWNEPNNPVFLQPQYSRVGGRWVAQAARDYARICTAVHQGVHLTLLRNLKVGCGVTAPRGGGAPTSKRPSLTPLQFLREARKAGMRSFDVYAHHPYYNLPSEAPDSKPRNFGAVTLGNINKLITELTKLYGRKRLWITEYGYQTWKPDRKFGVTWARQAAYLKQAYAIARKNPRIDMMLWFLIRDDPNVRRGWQSGFFTAGGKRKPAATAFQRLPR